MQPVLVDLDGTSDFLFVVRIRGRLLEAEHPVWTDMAIFDERVFRADYSDEHTLRFAVRALAFKLIGEMFIGCNEWNRLLEDELQVEPLSAQEAIVILLQYLTLDAKWRGEDLTPFVDGSFSLIAEDDGVLKARTKLAATLPPGRTVGNPMQASLVEPQQGGSAP